MSLMKKLLATIILSLCFITPSQADDIRDFQIEGISVGDSLLDHYNITEINAQLKKIKSTYTSNKFIRNEFRIKGNSIYDQIRVHYRNDKTYEIVELAGIIFYRNNTIDECYAKRNEIAKDIATLFPSAKKKKERWKSKQFQGSIFEKTRLKLNSGETNIICRDWSKKIEEKYRWIDNLSVSIRSQEYVNWLTYEAYK